MTPAARRSALVLTIAALALLAANFLFTAHYVRTTQATQQRQGQLIEQKLCATLNGLAELKPPPGNPSRNPSRAYLQEEHARLAQLGADLGCTAQTLTPLLRAR